MLILNRKIGQSVILGDGKRIEIVLLKSSQSRATIGVIADSSIPVYRDELLLHPIKETFDDDANA